MNDPFARLPAVPGFSVSGTDVTDGQALPLLRGLRRHVDVAGQAMRPA
jgi:hypothetical protein